MKTLKCIDYQQGKILVDEEAEIKEGDWFYGRDKQIHLLKSSQKVTAEAKKIIAQTPNLNLEGVPCVEISKTVIKDNGYKCKECGSKVSLGGKCKKGCSMKPGNLIIDVVTYVEVEEDVETIAHKYCNYYDAAKVEGFIAGYKAAQPKKYTEDDLRKAIRMMQKKVKAKGKFGEPWERYPTEEEVVQSLQPKIESVEIETKTVFDGDDEHDEGGTLPSVVESYEQPITYQKDGRTYLKVNKINNER